MIVNIQILVIEFILLQAIKGINLVLW